MDEHHCFYCGEPVDKGDFGYIGPSRVFVCDAQECNQELQAEDRAAYEEECDRLREDWYGP